MSRAPATSATLGADWVEIKVASTTHEIRLDQPVPRRETDRLLDAIDATGDGMASVIDLRLNQMSYSLTAVATVFLLPTFLVGFFA